MNLEQASILFDRLAGHWPGIASNDAAADDWLAVIRRLSPEAGARVASTIITGWKKDRAPRIADWQDTVFAQQMISDPRPPSIEGAGCLHCAGTGWLVHTSGHHWTIGNSVTGPFHQEATDRRPILQRCSCGTMPGDRRQPEEHFTEEEMAAGRERVGQMIAEIRAKQAEVQRRIKREGLRKGLRLADPPPSRAVKRTTDIPGGPKWGMPGTTMTPEERQAELDAIGGRRIRQRRP